MPRTVEVMATVMGVGLRSTLTASGGPHSVYIEGRAMGKHLKLTMGIADAEKARDALCEAIEEARRQRTMPL